MNVSTKTRASDDATWLVRSTYIVMSNRIGEVRNTNIFYSRKRPYVSDVANSACKAETKLYWHRHNLGIYGPSDSVTMT